MCVFVVGETGKGREKVKEFRSNKLFQRRREGREKEREGGGGGGCHGYSTEQAEDSFLWSWVPWSCTSHPTISEALPTYFCKSNLLQNLFVVCAFCSWWWWLLCGFRSLEKLGVLERGKSKVRGEGGRVVCLLLFLLLLVVGGDVSFYVDLGFGDSR